VARRGAPVSGKRPTGRFGSIGPHGAPLPLVTQPMIPLDESGNPIQVAAHVDPRATRVENPLSRPDVAAVFSKPTSMIAAAAVAPAGPPPEIGLTQHALPPDEPIDSRLALVLDPDSERAAAFRVLRHHLLELGRPQVIVVASPRPSDGKTTVAVNLALALAECNRAKVVLVEANVGRPQLANVFRLMPPWCFAEQLASHRHQPLLPWSLVDISQLWLHVAAVSPRVGKTQLLDAPAFAIAMERMRAAGYEHIVVDAPAVLGSADVNLIADAADVVLLAARARRTTARDLRKAIEQIGASKVAGTVLVH
jgi:Mrp family chromosome partitioning ATPase